MAVKKEPDESLKSGLSAGLRRFLYVTAATTGAVILIVEILGAKMLSPYLGTSHFVWTAQIGVTLVSLATGYYFGGWLVDRSPRLERLYSCILLAAIYLCLTIGVCESVAYACLKFDLAIGSILTSLFLFFVPLTLLAAVGPFAIRVLTQSVSVVGGQVGRLTSVSTFGSVAGTLLISYVLIPFLPNSITMYLTGGILMVLTAVYFLVWGRTARLRPAVLVGILAGGLIGFAGVRNSGVEPDYAKELYRGNSNFGIMQVLKMEGSGRLFYLNDYLTQNTYDPESKQSTSLFTYMLHDLAREYTDDIQDVLCIGMGVGIVPMNFAREGAAVDVVEINPAVVPIAKEYFDCEPDLFNLVIGDGRYYLNQTTNRYDAVVLDAFLGDSSPSHLMTREAFQSIQQRLKPGGTLVINSFGDFAEGRDFLTASLQKTLETVFASVRIHTSGNGNVFYVASDRPELEMEGRPSTDHVNPMLRNEYLSAMTRTRQANLDHGMILTDDYNPVDFYDAANREELRRRLAMSMQPESGF